MLQRNYVLKFIIILTREVSMTYRIVLRMTHCMIHYMTYSYKSTIVESIYYIVYIIDHESSLGPSLQNKKIKNHF